jgi:hypothetical protein
VLEGLRVIFAKAHRDRTVAVAVAGARRAERPL